MIDGERLSVWKTLRSWWYTAPVRPLDLVLNSRAVAGFHLNNVRSKLPLRYRQAMLHIIELHQAGRIKPRIDSSWTFDEVFLVTCLSIL